VYHLCAICPALPWQLVSQDLFQLDGVTYLVTVEHCSDFYEIDKLPNIQSPTVIQATKKHFSHYGVPHTLITDNGTSDLEFSSKYKFHHITSSPYWSQSNGRAEAAVKSAKHIWLTADDVDIALLSVRSRNAHTINEQGFLVKSLVLLVLDPT
jgi:hypothetical protein